MAYTDPKVTYIFQKTTGIPWEVEDTAGIMLLEGRTADAATAGDASLDAVRCPAGGLIESFGAIITEALTNGNATHLTLVLKAVDKEGGTTTSVATITFPKNSTEVTVGNVSGGQVLPSTATAAQAVAAGARIVSSASTLPYQVPQGGRFYVEVTQAAGAAGGAFRAFVQCRQDGTPAATSASPVTKIAS